MRGTWLVALCLVASPAYARPYQVEDMLRLESYGQVVIDPTERWAIVERRAPYETAARFDYGYYVVRAASKLYLVDLQAPGAAAPAFPQEASGGYWSGGFSPSGRRLAVFRLKDNRIRLGILELATRDIRWLRDAPDLPIASPSPVWIDDDRLIYVSRTRDDLPLTLATGDAQQRIARDWQRATEGDEPSVATYGSGAYRDLGLATEGMAVVSVDLRRNASQRLYQGSITDIALSADRQQLAIVERGPAVQPEVDRPVSPSFQPRRQRLKVIDLRTGRSRDPCRDCDVLPNLLSWSPARPELLFFARADDEPWESGRLYLLRTDQPPVAVLPDSLRIEAHTVGGSNVSVRATWAGVDPLVLARETSGETTGWYRITGAGPMRVSPGASDQLLAASETDLWSIADGALVHSVGGRPPRRLDTGRIVSVGPDLLDPRSAGARAYFNGGLEGIPALVADENGAIRAIGVDQSTGRISWAVELPSMDSRLLAAARRNGSVVYLRKDAHGVGTLTLSGPRGPGRVIDRINRHLSDTDVVERIAIRSTGPEGQQLTHWLTIPQNAERPALVVIPYPGTERGEGSPPPHDAADFNPPANPLIFAAAGYAVLEPSIPTSAADTSSAVAESSTSRVTAETRVSTDPNEDPIGRMTNIVLGAVDAAIGSGRIAPDRIALVGQSFGAYGSVAMATRTNRFHAVIASDGAYDLAATYGRLSPQGHNAENGINLTIPFGWFEAGQGGLGAPVWRIPNTYIARSPFYAVEHIRTPLMLIHGDMDFLPVSEAERLFMALHRLGRDAVLLRYAGEGHTLTSPANIRDQWQRSLAFLDVHLRLASPQRPQ